MFPPAALPSSRSPDGTNFLGVARVKVPMAGGAGGFATLKGAIETATNVPAARATYAAKGRAAAAAKLKGARRRLVGKATEGVKISVQRAVELSPRSCPPAKPKRVQPSGRPTGWPKTKVARDAWYKRRAERAARGEPVGRAAKMAAAAKKAAAVQRADFPTGTGTTRDDDLTAYVPTPAEEAAFRDLMTSTANSLGVDQSRVTAPVCHVSMSAPVRPVAAGSATNWWQPIHARGKARAHMFVAVEPQTPSRSLRTALQEVSEGNGGSGGWAPQNPGDGLLIPGNTSMWEAPGEGDFVLEVSMSIV